MNEVLVVLDKHGNPIYWHEPKAGYIPDATSLWNALWDNRYSVRGIAHSHPSGCRFYSQMDVTTFAAIEKGLGRRLEWWVITDYEIARYKWHDGEYQENSVKPGDAYLYDSWISEMRQKSGY